MLNRPTRLLSAAILVAAASTATAQDRHATVLLKSGERVAGTFEDIQNNQLYLRLNQNEERRIGVDQVAVIDFVGGTRGLPETELSQARGQDDLLLLRNGSSVKGELVDVRREGEGGAQTVANAPVHVIFSSPTGRQEVPVDQVARLYFGPIPDLSKVEAALATAASSTTNTGAAAAGSGFTAGTGVVSATQQWTPTGIFVRAGQMVAFNASGEITLGANETASAAGTASQRRDSAAPLPQAFAGALIGRVGTSTPFGIGNQTGQLSMPASGELFLGINESAAGLADNSGQFSVQITPSPVTRRR